MPSRFQISSYTFLLAVICCWPAVAQDRLLNEIYGQGVHAFHGGNYTAATRLLDDAISLGLNDPRAYYYRAFAKTCRGNRAAAESDIRLGAELEVSGAGTYDIGKALERVQGRERLRFESIRRYAMLDAMRARANQVPAAPTFESPTRDFLREPVPRLDDPALVPPADSDPFTGDEEVDEVLDDPAADQGPSDPLDDGLGSDMGNELLDEPAEGVTEPPAEDTDPFGDESDPFGDESDPFGDDAATTPPAAEIDESATEPDPFGDEADPFGDEADPFGDEADPFGSTETPLPDLDSLFNE